MGAHSPHISHSSRKGHAIGEEGISTGPTSVGTVPVVTGVGSSPPGTKNTSLEEKTKKVKVVKNVVTEVVVGGESKKEDVLG